MCACCVTGRVLDICSGICIFKNAYLHTLTKLASLTMWYFYRQQDRSDAWDSVCIGLALKLSYAKIHRALGSENIDSLHD